METNDIKAISNKNTKENIIEENNSYLDIKIKSCLFGIRKVIKGNLDKSKKKDLQYLEEQEEFDNTNENVIFEQLNLQPSYKLLLNNFNILNKEQLSKFKITKKYNNEETYFYLLEYLGSIKILESKEESGAFTKETKKNKKHVLTIKFSNGSIEVKKKKIEKEKSNSEEKTDENYEEMIHIKNINIDEYFKVKEEITIKDLSTKMKEYYDKITFIDEQINNIPYFQSELFYYYQLKNILETFNEMTYNEKKKKIKMITYLQDFINKVKNKKIKDRTVLFYFYLLIDIEYELDLCVWLLIHNYEEKYLSYKGASINKKENKLYINDSNIIIENFDNYKLNQADNKKIKSGKIKLPLNAEFFSLKVI